jgi:uncharacterized protein
MKVEPAFDSVARRRGLLGRDGLAEGTGLVIAPCSSIHTFFMRFPIDVLFAGKDGLVLSMRHSLGAWRVALSFRAFAVIELPAGTIARTGVVRGSVLEVVPATGAVSL